LIGLWLNTFGGLKYLKYFWRWNLINLIFQLFLVHSFLKKVIVLWLNEVWNFTSNIILTMSNQALIFKLFHTLWKSELTNSKKLEMSFLYWNSWIFNIKMTSPWISYKFKKIISSFIFFSYFSQVKTLNYQFSKDFALF